MKPQDWIVADDIELTAEELDAMFAEVEAVDRSEYDARASYQAWQAMQEEVDAQRFERMNERMDAGLAPF